MSIAPAKSSSRSSFLFGSDPWSWRRDLNPRPSDYKSDALPAELRQPVHSGNQPGILKTIPFGCTGTLLLSTLNGTEIKVSTPLPREQTNRPKCGLFATSSEVFSGLLSSS